MRTVLVGGRSRFFLRHSGRPTRYDRELVRFLPVEEHDAIVLTDSSVDELAATDLVKTRVARTTSTT